MFLVIQIAAGILLAALVLALLWLGYKAFGWAVRKGNERIEEEKFIDSLAAAMKLEREGDREWLRSTKKKD